MAESNLKELYEASLPTAEHIDEIFDILKEGNLMADRAKFVTTSNRVFGMLAHLKVETMEQSEQERLMPIMEMGKYQTFLAILGMLRITAPNACCTGAGITPSATPIIQRYIEVFEIYEKENGMK